MRNAIHLQTGLWSYFLCHFFTSKDNAIDGSCICINMLMTFLYLYRNCESERDFVSDRA